MAKGCSVTTASRKMMVSPASRIVRAISFGVFCRLAPSTRAIMRSRKVSPGLDVMRTDDLVREHPGPARDRGAVAAALADDRCRLARDGGLVDRGDALDHVAVAGDHLPGGHHAEVAELQLRSRASPRVGRRVRRTLAIVSALVRRSVAACALPRPSAMASAKLANSTVNHSHSGDEPGEHVLVGRRRAEVPEEQHGRERQNRPRPRT